MTVTRKHPRTITPRSTRDLRAEVVDLAATLAGTADKGVLVIKEPRLNVDTIRSEWQRLMKAFPSDLQSRLELEILDSPQNSGPAVPSTRQVDEVDLAPPNFKFEVMRMLIGASIMQSRSLSVEDLVEKIGASDFTVRKVLGELVDRGIARRANARFAVDATDISPEVLGTLQALPERLHFRYAAGTRPRSTGELIERFEQLMQPDPPEGWENVALSGSAASNYLRLPQVDLLGVPRVDLTAYVGKDAKEFDVTLIRKLDSGLEYIRDLFSPPSVVITVIRADPKYNYPDAVRSAKNADIYLALLDADLREQAVQFAAKRGKGYE